MNTYITDPLNPGNRVKISPAKRDYLTKRLQGLKDFMNIQSTIMAKNRLSYSSLRDCHIILEHYLQHKAGISPAGIFDFLRGRKGNYRALHHRLTRLRFKGFIYTKENKHFPTKLAYDELSPLYNNSLTKEATKSA